MSKVRCAAIDCKHNKGNKCSCKEVSLKEWYINTVHEGRKHLWECKNYEMSESARQIYADIEKYLKEAQR